LARIHQWARVIGSASFNYAARLEWPLGGRKSALSVWLECVSTYATLGRPANRPPMFHAGRANKTERPPL